MTVDLETVQNICLLVYYFASFYALKYLEYMVDQDKIARVSDESEYKQAGFFRHCFEDYVAIAKACWAYIWNLADKVEIFFWVTIVIGTIRYGFNKPDPIIVLFHGFSIATLILVNLQIYWYLTRVIWERKAIIRALTCTPGNTVMISLTGVLGVIELLFKLEGLMKSHFENAILIGTILLNTVFIVHEGNLAAVSTCLEH